VVSTSGTGNDYSESHSEESEESVDLHLQIFCECLLFYVKLLMFWKIVVDVNEELSLEVRMVYYIDTLTALEVSFLKYYTCLRYPEQLSYPKSIPSFRCCRYPSHH
jgi:hypothetical protein